MRDVCLSFLLILPFCLCSQILRVSPPNPTPDDVVTVVFDAASGNGALKGFEEDVYAHTGVILGTVDRPSGWRYAQGEWGKADNRLKMQRIGEDLYQIQFQIRNFYGFPEGVPFLQMAFVFRNENGSIVAKDKADQDIFYPKYTVFEHGPLEKASAQNAITLKGFEGMGELGDGSIYLSDGSQAVVLKSFGKGIFNVRYFPTGTVEAIPSQAVVTTPEDFVRVFEGNTKDPYRVAGIDPYNIRIHQAPTRFAFLDGNTEKLLDEDGFFYHKNLRDLGPLTGVRFQLAEDELLYGAGSRATGLNLKGERLYTYNTASYGYTGGEEDLNISIPFIMSSKGYGVFFDNPGKAYMDLGKSDPGIFEYGAKGSSLSYYVILGETPQKILQRYTRLTGRQPLPPMWALGYIQSRNGYKTQAETEKIVEETLKAGYPMDGLMLDLYWFGGKKNIGKLDWDRDKWPNPDKMIRDFKKKGIQTILVSEPYVVEGSRHFSFLDKNRYFATDKQGATRMIPDYWAGPAALMDVFKPEVSDWIWPFYKEQIEKGIAGWWSDSGEPENHPDDMQHATGSAEQVHNLYALTWSKFMFEKFKLDYPDQRFFNLQRSGYSGIQRYGAFPWSGDVSRSWEAYRAQIPLMLGSGLSGLAYMHANIGGYTGGPKDEELYRRWMQLGVFSPIMRVHGEAESIEPEPIFYNPATQKIAKEAIRLRYKLLPYNYSIAKQNSETGIPLARPMMMEVPEDSYAGDLEYQFFWGRELMVAPVLEKGKKYQDIYLPKGEWFDFYTEELIRGGNMEKMPVFDDKIPLYVRRGAWIPMAEGLPNSSEYIGDSLEIHYYPHPDKDFDFGSMYLDDGVKDEAFIKGEYMKLRFTGKTKGPKLYAQIKGEGKKRIIGSGINIYLHVHGYSQAPEYVKIFGKKVMISDLPDFVYSPGPESAYWDFSRSTVVIRINWKGSETIVEIKGYLK